MSSEDPSSAEQIRAHLQAAGYRLVWRESGWTECLALRTEERWIGRGEGEDEALEDLAGQLFPSHAARVLLQTALARALTPLGDAGVPPEPAAPLLSAAPVPLPVPDAPGAGATAAVAPHDGLLPAEREPESITRPEKTGVEAESAPEQSMEPAALATPEPEPEPEPVAAPEAEGAGSAPAEAVSQEAPRAPLVPVRQAARAWSVKEGLAAIEPLRDLIKAQQQELGLATPERQRIVMTGWIAEARQAEELSGHAGPVVARVGEIARDLTFFCKLWWPGSVVALQLNATPRTARAEVDGPDRSATAATWGDVASAAERAMAAVADRDASHGRDEYGWADGPAAEPAPIDPESDLGSLRARLEELTGPLTNPPARQVSTAAGADRQDFLRRLTEWARTARWVRGFVADFGTWAVVMGRLRWLAAGLKDRPPELAEALDPGFRPKASWSELLGRDPEAKRRKAQRARLLQELQALRPGDRAGWRAWVAAALPLLETAVLARKLQPFAGEVLAFAPEDVAESRSERRRWRKVTSALQGSEVLPPLSEPEPELATNASVEETASDPTARLLSQVLPHTSGRRIIFVSNRSDPELEAMLRDKLGFAEIQWCELSPRRIQALSESLGRGSSDFVLAATGFQSHAVDGKLYETCKRKGVPYIRVNKGRPVACAVAIARTFRATAPREGAG